MPLCVHGTAGNLSYLIPGHSRPKINSCWTCSGQDPFVYVWNLESFIEQGEMEEDCGECIENALQNNQLQEIPSIGYSLFRHALDSAFLQAALEGRDSHATVLLMDIPWSALAADLSCPNMSMANRFHPMSFDPSWVKGIYSLKFHAYYAPFLIATALDNPYFNADGCNTALTQLARALLNTKALDYYNIIDDCADVSLLEPYHSCSIPEFLQNTNSSPFFE